MEKKGLETEVFEWKCQGSEASCRGETSGERPHLSVTGSRGAWEQKITLPGMPLSSKPGSLREAECWPGGRLLQKAYEHSYMQHCR